MRLSLSALIAAVALAACSGPGSYGPHAERRLVDLGGSRFAVYRVGGQATAYRISPELRPPLRRTVLLGLLAIERVTGCGIRPGGWSGDRAIVRADLDCEAPAPRPLHLDCTVVAEWPIPALDQRVEEIECSG